MARSRRLAIAVLSLIFAAAPWQMAHSQSDSPPAPSVNPRLAEVQEARAGASCEPTCVVYPLSGLGDDPKAARWIAETIPEVIDPGTWAEAGGVGRIRCHAASKVLIITHTPAVHAKVTTFLRDLRKAMVAEGPAVASTGRPVVQAQYTEPATVKAAVSGRNAYLVPPPLKQPKHLFHLIIRYEGDGLGDVPAEKLLNQFTGNGPPAKEANEKACPEPAKGSLDQLLHVILRYEGEGIVDSNVVGLVKELAGSGGLNQRCAVPPQAVPACQLPNAPPVDFLQFQTPPAPTQPSGFGVPSGPPASGPSTVPPLAPSGGPAVPSDLP